MWILTMVAGSQLQLTLKGHSLNCTGPLILGFLFDKYGTILQMYFLFRTIIVAFFSLAYYTVGMQYTAHRTHKMHVN